MKYYKERISKRRRRGGSWWRGGVKGLRRGKKCLYVTLETKLKAVNRLVQGATVQKIALDFSLGAVTVGDQHHNWAKNVLFVIAYITYNVDII